MCFPHGVGSLAPLTFVALGKPFFVCFGYVSPKTECIFSLHRFSHGICSSQVFALLTLFRQILKIISSFSERFLNIVIPSRYNVVLAQCFFACSNRFKTRYPKRITYIIE